MLLRHFISKDEYTEHHSYRVSVYAARIAARLGPERRSHRGRARGRPAARHRQARDQPRAALQGGAADQGRIRARCRRTSTGASRCSSPWAGRCGASSRSSSPTTTSSTASGYHPTARRGDPDRGAHHLGGRCLRLADQRPPLSQGHVAVRRQGHPREGPRHRLRSATSSTRLWKRSSSAKWTSGRSRSPSLCCNGGARHVADAAVR